MPRTLATLLKRHLCISRGPNLPFVMGKEGIDEVLVVKGMRALGDCARGDSGETEGQRACHTLSLLDLPPSPVLRE